MSAASKVIIHRGLCGSSLKAQCIGIGVTYSLISCVGILMASLMLSSPGSYIQLELAVTKEIHQPLTDDNTTMEKGNEYSATDELEAITEHLIKQVGHNAVEMLVGCFATLLCSILLIQGVRKSKTSWLVPWIVESTIITLGNFVMFLVHLSTPDNTSIFKAFLMAVFLTLSAYFIISVYSFFVILKIQKKSVTTFLEHEFEGGIGDTSSLFLSPSSYYHTLDEDDTQLPPYREKTVPMTEAEDKGKEHVLYAQL